MLLLNSTWFAVYWLCLVPGIFRFPWPFGLSECILLPFPLLWCLDFIFLLLFCTVLDCSEQVLCVTAGRTWSHYLVYSTASPSLLSKALVNMGWVWDTLSSCCKPRNLSGPLIASFLTCHRGLFLIEALLLPLIMVEPTGPYLTASASTVTVVRDNTKRTLYHLIKTVSPESVCHLKFIKKWRLLYNCIVCKSLVGMQQSLNILF